MVTATAWSATPSSFDVLGLNPLGSRRAVARTVPPSLISTFGRLGASATSPVRSTTTPATTTATAARAASHRQRRTPLTGPALDGGRPRPPRHGRPRPATPSLARIRETWTLAVLGVMNSSWPIWRLVRPAATSARTSASRG
jgi:hypothetical protein